MTIEALNIWQSTFKDEVIPTDGPEWPSVFTNWYAARFDTPNLSLPGLTIASGNLPVTFGKAAFEAVFSTLAPGLTQAAAMAIIANAWEAGLIASTVSVLPGDSVGAPLPATIWSVVSASIFDPASVVLGKAKILELIGAENVGDALDAAAPVKFREATLLLTATTTGLDSTPAPAGPLPLVDTARAVG